MENILRFLYRLMVDQPIIESPERDAALEALTRAEVSLETCIGPVSQELLESWQTAYGHLFDLDAEADFRQALALGMELGRLRPGIPRNAVN